MVEICTINKQQMMAMNNLYYVVSGIFFITWFLGFMVFDAGKEIHFVFLVAVLVMVLKIYKDHKINNK